MAMAGVADRRKSWGSGSCTATSAAFLFFLALAIGTVISARWITTAENLSVTSLDIWYPKLVVLNTPTPTTDPTTSTTTIHLKSPPTQTTEPGQRQTQTKDQNPKPNPRPIPFSCPYKPEPEPEPDLTTNQANITTITNITDTTVTCPAPPQPIPKTTTSSKTCPSYFRYIHEDLKPWRAQGGITRDMVESAGRTANFRLVILKGHAYLEQYEKSFQTRDVFTLWGILQLLRRYPGRLPDLDIMFDCVDWPVVREEEYRGANASMLPPVFRYCADDETLDIVFPDWSFWGWPEINIKPWDSLKKELKEGNGRVKWLDREPYAYWKGNPDVAETRQQLMECNVSETQDWNARLYKQDWIKESQVGYKQSDLASQCTHRYKIYIEGSAWSVSEKYILACDSMTLVVTPKYYDFFSRILMPVHHYWPIREDNKCSSIKFAVDWGNSHKKKAKAIGTQASQFIQQEVTTDSVYDYMFHLLNEYAKLLQYKPSIPHNATEICPESMVCHAQGLDRKFMLQSMVNVTHPEGPCDLAPPFTPVELQMMQKRKENAIKQVETWEQGASKRAESKL